MSTESLYILHNFATLPCARNCNVAWQLSSSSASAAHGSSDPLLKSHLLYTHVLSVNSFRTDVNPFVAIEKMTDVLNADILFAYLGIIITATVSVFAGSYGSLPVSPPSVNRASLFNWSSSLGMMPRSPRAARRMMVARTRTMIPSLD